MVIGVCTACFRIFMLYTRHRETGINYTHIFQGIQGRKKNKKKKVEKWEGTRGVFLSFSFYLSLYHHPTAPEMMESKTFTRIFYFFGCFLLFFVFFDDPTTNRHRRSVATVTITNRETLLHSWSGKTERERVLWPVYLDNPTCRIRIEKGSRSLSFFLPTL